MDLLLYLLLLYKHSTLKIMNLKWSMEKHQHKQIWQRKDILLQMMIVTLRDHQMCDDWSEINWHCMRSNR